MAENNDKVVTFFHGPEASIDGKIQDGTITGADIVITSDSDSIFYVDSEKAKHRLGGKDPETTVEHEVNLGAGGTVGGLKTGDTISAGTSLDDIIKMLTQVSVPASYTKPGVTIRTTAGKPAGSYEVGENVSTTLQAIFTKNDAGALTSLTINKDGAAAPVASGTETPLNSEEQTFQIPDGSVVFSASATYAEGAIKNDNLGNPSPDGHITAGTAKSANVTFTGRRNLFFGAGDGAVPEMTSAEVRVLANKRLNPTNGLVFEVPLKVGQQHVAFAYPAALRDVSQVMYVETNDTGMASSFTKQVVSVEGANGAAGVDYKVYTYGMATPAAANMTFKVTI